MTDITPSDTQARAIAAIKDWFENRTHEQQVFRLFGYAGSGKSTVLKFALDELGLEPHRGDRDGGDCVPGRRHRHLHRQGGAGAAPQGHAGPHHPQPDLQRHRGDRGGDRGGAEEDRAGGERARAG